MSQESLINASTTGNGKMTPGSLFEFLGHQRGGPDRAKSGPTLVRGSPEAPNFLVTFGSAVVSILAYL